MADNVRQIIVSKSSKPRSLKDKKGEIKTGKREMMQEVIYITGTTKGKRTSETRHEIV